MESRIPRVAVSIVVPCYNEAGNIGALHGRLSAACRDAVGDDYEIVYVNDGSRDATWASIRGVIEQDEARIVGINLSRNFGHQMAVTAGLEHAQGHRVLIIDADLQDPPELLRAMMEKMTETKADVVFGRRTKRLGESTFKRATAAAFYRLFRATTDIDMPDDTGDFRLVSRRVVETLQQMPEHHRFLRGMVAWVGYRQEPFPYERQERYSGETKYPLRKMLRFSLDAFTGFSIAPLRFATILSLASIALAMVIGLYIVIGKLSGSAIQGWTSVMLVVVLFGSIQLLVLGILGEYIGRLMMEAKHRPLYLVDAVVRKSGAVLPLSRKETNLG